MIKPNLPEEILNWLYFADEDYQSAKIMLDEEIYNKVCFLCQQAIEKLLKAYLLYNKKEIKRTHKIVDLLRECIDLDKKFLDFADNAVEIDRYYIPTRYPDAIVGMLPEGLPKKEQAESALEIASKLGNFAKNKLGI